jgi:hypothetical protein
VELIIGLHMMALLILGSHNRREDSRGQVLHCFEISRENGETSMEYEGYSTGYMAEARVKVVLNLQLKCDAS